MPDYETTRSEVGPASRRDFSSFGLDEESPVLSEAELDERQASLGETRKPAGPGATADTAADPEDPDAYGDDVEPTELELDEPQEQE